ncbi:MAG: hypothetical protein IPK03_11820 [Bacteroidetes bacterium]|nr:hypothetical protein [Bacteroidota bacterium]
MSKNLDLGLFEGVILSRNKGFELQYLNPIIFYRAIEQSLGSPDNAVVGADFKLNVARTAQLYGQFLLDEFNFGEITANKGWWGNKLGAQLGLKYIDAFKIKNLDLQGEFNMVMPYTYTHRSPAITDSAANYTHYNQSMAHPLGANFREIIFVIRYQPIKRLNTQFKWFNTARGADTTGQSWGSDIFFPASANTIPKEYGNSMMQGYRTEVNLFELRCSYMLYHNLFIDLHGTYRKSVSELSSLNNSEVYIGAGVRLNIARRENEF